jgi:hypothetical protein
MKPARCFFFVGILLASPNWPLPEHWTHFDWFSVLDQVACCSSKKIQNIEYNKNVVSSKLPDIRK